jgi:hypothetical protein
MTAGDAANGASAYYYDAFTQGKSPETSSKFKCSHRGRRVHREEPK